MSDFEQDPRVAHLLNTTSHEATRFIQPRGVQAVRTTVRHRRRNRVVGVAALAAIALVGAPVAGMNLTSDHRPVNPPAATTTPSDPATPAPSTPQATPPSAPASAPGKSPDRKITAKALRNATLTIPAWPADGFGTACPSGKVHFSGGRGGSLLRLEGSPIYQDVDRDGAPETLSVLSCNMQGADYQVLAFKPGKGGAVTTVGRVVGSGWDPGDIQKIWSIQPAGDGEIRVDVGEYRACCNMVQASQHQWRTYGWSGGRFRQTGGPTSFGPNPKVTDLRVSSDGVPMTKQADGTWKGTLTASVHNVAGFATPDRVQLGIRASGTWRATAAVGCTIDPDGLQPMICTMPAMAKGATRTVTVTLTAPAGTLPTTAELHAACVTEDGAGYPAKSSEDATTSIAITHV
ncbi:hypothetical protein HH310_29320 [Actinoplanes sp. TBRC 11911]|uniref:hypothetical protein n=1 Tax=Actinoplanes sp. TBRC 11911 TaxID=2729386 RepID=UPI00145E15F3|nr:hypothetical protein [Actinoplanes sp. TBRC 11911]NMO55272.1 hypothetical protein [Actinoplanes sp. TBRC 11911]